MTYFTMVSTFVQHYLELTPNATYEELMDQCMPPLVKFKLEQINKELPYQTIEWAAQKYDAAKAKEKFEAITEEMVLTLGYHPESSSAYTMLGSPDSPPL